MELRDKDESLFRKSRAPLNQDLAASRTPKGVEIVKLDHSKRGNLVPHHQVLKNPVYPKYFAKDCIRLAKLKDRLSTDKKGKTID